MSENPSAGSVRIAFFGTAELACASLRALARAAGVRLEVVVTQPDRPQGRSLRRQPPPVKRAALELGLPVWQPERCRAPEFLERMHALGPDLIVVAAYGQILPPPLLEQPRLGCLNVHASLLPKYRGAAPIQWALLEGERYTGVTIMRMDAGLDTGDIVTQETTAIGPDEDAASLHDRLAALGADLLVRTIPGYVAGELVPRPQPVEGVSYARKITREDGRLDWSRPAVELDRRLRAFTPWPGAFTHLREQGRSVLLKVWRAVCVPQASGEAGTVLRADPRGLLVAAGAGALEITELQREGGRRLTAAEFLAGRPMAAGSVLG